MTDDLTTDGWASPTPELLAAIIARTKGRGGAEDEWSIGATVKESRAGLMRFSSTHGAETAYLLARNSDAIRQIRVYDYGDTLSVLVRLNTALCRRPGDILKPYRTPEQREAAAARGRALAAS